MYNNRGSLSVFWNIYKANRDLSFIKRVNRAYDKMLFFKQHTNRQLHQIHTQANKQQQPQQSMLTQATSVIQQYSNKVKSKIQQFKPAQYIPFQPKQIDFNTIVNNPDIKSNSQKIFQYILSHSIVFYNSIQALVEGRRQVLTNPNLVLWDGETVSQKQEKFQKFVKYLVDKLNAK